MRSMQEKAMARMGRLGLAKGAAFVGCRVELSGDGWIAGAGRMRLRFGGRGWVDEDIRPGPVRAARFPRAVVMSVWIEAPGQYSPPCLPDDDKATRTKLAHHANGRFYRPCTRRGFGRRRFDRPSFLSLAD